MKFVPAPGGDPTQVVPVIRVYVSKAAPGAAGETARMESNEVQRYGAPAGATGHYDAPLTKNRSSDPNDPIAHINLERAIDRAHRLNSLTEMMRNPRFVDVMDRGEKVAGPGVESFLSALYSVGGTMPAKQETTQNLNLGGSTLRITTDHAGREIGRETLEHTPAPVSPDKAPTVRDVVQGENTQSMMWDAKQGQYVPIGKAGPRFKPAAAGGDGASTGLSEDAIDLLAREATKDRMVLSNIGRGVQGARDLRSVLNKMAEDAKTSGDGSIVAKRAAFGADKKALDQLIPQYDAIIAFEENARQQGRILVDLAKRVDSTGIPVVERWIRAGRRKVQGDPDVAEFNAQMQLYRTEAARIMTQPRLVGQLTDSARHEMKEFLDGNDSAPQIERVVQRLERDFDVRKKTLEEQIDRVRTRLAEGHAPGGDARQKHTVNGDRRSPQPPSVGTVMQGYRFKGGDPSQQANWEPVR